MPQSWSRPGTCRLVCVPGRTRPRPWRVCDVARVARYAAQEGESWEEIIAAVVRTSEVRDDLCDRPAQIAAIEGVRELRATLRPLEDPIFARAIRWIERIVLRAPKGLQRILLLVLAALKLLERLPDFLDTLDEVIRNRKLEEICSLDPCARGQLTTEDQPNA